MAMAKLKPAPFVVLYIDSTSRLGRNLSEVLMLTKILKHNGIFLHIASTGLDSRNPAFEMVLTMMGMMDEVFVSELSAKVRGGMQGQVKRGYHPAGRCFGYENVREDDYERREVGGHAALKGVRQVIDPEEAAIVYLIFKMYAEGNSYDRIAKFLNGTGVLSPGHFRKGGMRSWYPTGIAHMLTNERYRGTVIFGKTKVTKNPETGATELLDLPASTWTIQYHEEMRIIPDALWDAVRLQNSRILEKHGSTKLGGMNRTNRSRRYVFSGPLRCGLRNDKGEVCGANIIILRSQAPNAYYGCPLHRSGGCNNRLLIKQSSLEEQLLGAIVSALRAPESLAQLHGEFTRQLEQAVKDESVTARQALGNHDALKKESASLRCTVERLTEAIAGHGLSHALSAKLRQSEVRMEEITRLLAAKDKPAPPQISAGETEEFLKRKVDELVEVLLGDPVRTKQELLNRIDKLVLTPEVRDGEEVYVVQGDVRLFGANDDAMLTSSGPCIGEHYTTLRISLDGFVLLPGKVHKRKNRQETSGVPLPEPPVVNEATEFVVVAPIIPGRFSQEAGITGDNCQKADTWTLSGAETSESLSVGTPGINRLLEAPRSVGDPTVEDQYGNGFVGPRLAPTIAEGVPPHLILRMMAVESASSARSLPWAEAQAA
jgi:DNA invertase Pin-like site-specific DNA recombinase